MLPSFAANGFLPLGRYSLSVGEAEDMLVLAPEFLGSDTRWALWDGLNKYLEPFFALEDSYADALDGRTLIHRLWLGGSFVSAKTDPRNIDATLLIDVGAERAVRGRPGSKWLTTAFQSRAHMLRKFGVSPVRVGYRPVGRGVWDDWWQRCRLPGHTDRSPSHESAAPARGYLEVRL
ncbi:MULTISPECIES: DUF6932 family protein [Streptomyces]|uniref:DUF6932 family protein n=1 Tax=Streptomyces lienomycini TaxID=284035 RepID=A0ABV9WVC6_9ACTN|nr:hypothetical protein [Streptomyces lienomycini]